MLQKFLTDHNYKVSKHLTSNLIMAIIVLGASVFTFGFETAVVSTVQAMDHFEKQFGEYNPKTKTYFLSADRLAYLNSLPLILNGVGIIIASQMSERWGRRIVVISMNTICIIGVLVSIFSKSYAQILTGRLILYTHVGMESYLVPMYLAEIVPAAIRGSVVACWAFSHIFAGFISSIITNFTAHIDSNESWRIPIALILIFPAFVLLTVFLVPESPRWLLRKGRFQDAINSIYYLHSADRDYPAEQEALLIQETINNATSQGKWSELFKGTNKRRTWIGILAAATTQLTGQTFASNYGTVFLKSLNVMDPFTGTMIKRAMLVAACLFVIFTIEKLGRRRLCIVVGAMTAITLMVMGGLGTVQPKQKSVSYGILAMTLLHPVFYMIAFGSNLQIVKSELPHTSLRDKSGMVHWSVANICNFAATFTLPYLLKAPYANLGPKVGFVYGSLTVVLVILLYIFMPEMTNRSLEEVDEMMEARVPAWRTRDWKATGLSSRVTQLGNDPHSVSIDAGEKGAELGHVSPVHSEGQRVRTA